MRLLFISLLFTICFSVNSQTTNITLSKNSSTVYASSIPGVILDCNITNGEKIGGGKPTDNAEKINAVLAKANSNYPIHLIIDGGSALGAALVIPKTGHVSISGNGWSTGFFMLSGSNCNLIQTSDVGKTNLEIYKAMAEPFPTEIIGSNVDLSNFRFNGNRGIYPYGVVDGKIDHTLDNHPSKPAYAPDGRSPFYAFFWYTGILLRGLENIHIDRIWIYDCTTYAINLYNCKNVWVTSSRFESPDRKNNTDGVHINGGCSSVFVSNNWFGVGDDPFAVNLEEGNQHAGSDFHFTHNVLDDCMTGGRVYGKIKARSYNVVVANNTGSVREWGFQIGLEFSNEVGHIPDLNQSVTIDGCIYKITSYGWYGKNTFLHLNGNAGFVEISRCKIIAPVTGLPMVRVTTAGTVVSSLRIIDCGIHRNEDGNEKAFALEASVPGTLIKDLVIDGFHVTEQAGKTYPDIPNLVYLNGTNVGTLSLDANVQGVETVLHIGKGSKVERILIKDLQHQSNAEITTKYSIVVEGEKIPVSLGRYSAGNVTGIAKENVTISGPGLLNSGMSVDDTLVADNVFYLSSVQGKVCCKVGGKIKTITLTNAPRSSSK